MDENLEEFYKESTGDTTDHRLSEAAAEIQAWLVKTLDVQIKETQRKDKYKNVVFASVLYVGEVIKTDKKLISKDGCDRKVAFLNGGSSFSLLDTSELAIRNNSLMGAHIADELVHTVNRFCRQQDCMAEDQLATLGGKYIREQHLRQKASEERDTLRLVLSNLERERAVEKQIYSDRIRYLEDCLSEQTKQTKRFELLYGNLKEKQCK